MPEGNENQGEEDERGNLVCVCESDKNALSTSIYLSTHICICMSLSLNLKNKNGSGKISYVGSYGCRGNSNNSTLEGNRSIGVLTK